MRTYLLKRLLLFIPTAFGVSIVIFVMLHTIPGDYATALFVGGEGTSIRSEEHTSELQSLVNLVCRLLLEKKKST